MNNKLKIAIAAGITVATVAYVYFKVLSSEIALFELFPDIDPQIVVKAHRRMLRQILTFKYIDVDLDDEAILEEIFLDNVHEIQKNQ